MTKKQFEKFINSFDFGQDVKTDFYGTDNESGYLHDKAVFNKARKEAFDLLASIGKIKKNEWQNALLHAWCGRVGYENKHFTYIPGQFYELELPQAALAVLEYIRNRREECRPSIPAINH